MSYVFLNSILSFLSLVFLWVFIVKIKMSFSLIEEINKKNKKIKKWNKVVAKIVDISHGTNYLYKDYLPDTSHLKSEKDTENFLMSFEANEQYKQQLISLIGDVNLRYRYFFNNEEFESLSIGPIPSKEDYKIMYRLKVGSKIKVYVNPKKPIESYIRTEKKESLQSLFNKILMKDIKYLVFSLIFLILTVLSFL